MNDYYFKNYLITANLHAETYLDNQLILIQTGQISNLPSELKNCICCFKHSNNIMSLQKPNCDCCCRHFRRIIENKIESLNN